MPSTSATSRKLSFELRGAGGEPIHFGRAIRSHGLLFLPPGAVADGEDEYRLRVDLGVHHLLTFRARNGMLEVASDRATDRRERAQIERIVRRVFRLDDDLAAFYALAADDTDLAWAGDGAGRLLASPTVFEDVIKTICTTNCTWSATQRMIGALVARGSGAFPSAETLARTPPSWFTDVARMGYRGAFIATIARDVVAGLDLETLRAADGADEEEVRTRLLALPGVGPYAAAHVMQLLGFHRHLILDSATRPKFLRRSGMKTAKDATIRRRFARYGRFAGLAFWLYVTRDWFVEGF